jgi:hypothetical protein
VDRDNNKVLPVARYVSEPWREWLQTNRVELNAMTTPQFLDWLERKFLNLVGKVVPPHHVLERRLRAEVREQIRSQVTDRILLEARLEQRVEAAVATFERSILDRLSTLPSDVERGLAAQLSSPWWEPVERIAREIASTTRSGATR